ncbi:MAG: glutathione S-transferase [Alphaproteobacteria bacterium]|nr:glutathione S-transferase [Alphaproteobacteria bacterium]
MKLFYSPASPYARKVMACAHELGVADRIELVTSAASPVKRDQNLSTANPLGKIPTLVLEDGFALYDSRVICEYLDAEAGGRLFPADRRARWRALREQATADGLLDAALLARYETTLRPAELQWTSWRDGQAQKIAASLDMIEAEAAGYGDRVDIGTLATGSALGYLDFRFAHEPWRPGRANTTQWFARFNARKSMQATAPVDRPAPKP